MHLDSELKEDCKVWLQFLSDPELSKVMCRPMVDLFGLAAMSRELCFYSDASAAKNLGFGCILNSRWIQGYWPADFIACESSIEVLELYVMTAGLLTWRNQPELNNCHIIVFCDNMAVVQMINNMTSGCKTCMKLLRLITLSGLKHNLRVSARFVPTKLNFLADSLQEDNGQDLGCWGSK